MIATRPSHDLVALVLLLTACGSKTSASPTPEPVDGDAQTQAAAPAPQASSPEVIQRSSGAQVWVHDVAGLAVHTYMAPFEAFANTTHVIEGPTSLVVIDPQMTIASAKDARAYVDSIGKPIERLIVSHAHPDHYLGVAAAWEDVPSHALAGTLETIRTTGEATRQARVAMFPEGWLADHVTAPQHTLATGAATIDGVSYVFERFEGAEHPEQLVVRLPDHDVAIVQDLAYVQVHPVITDRDALGSWGAHIDTLLATGDTSLVLAGHGPPTDAAGLAAMKTYLSEAQSLLGSGADAAAFKAGMMQAFPERGGEGFVDFSLFFLFPPVEGAGHE